MSVSAADAVLDELRDLGLTPDARNLELPWVGVIGPRRARKPTRKAMLGNLFYVYGSEARLRSPIDWLQDPEGSRSWRYELHTLTWLREALARHAGGGDVETLAVARDAALDWARAHQDPAGEQSEFAWYDMAVGLRAPYLAYVLRACLAEGMLDGSEADLLLAATERHGDELARRDNYAAHNNHGLFQDEGLYLLARLLPALPAASAWRELALGRLDATLHATVSFADGAHLEHSTAYQFALVDLVARLATNVDELPELAPLLDRLRLTAAWQTTPAGRMAQLGDTDDLPAPRWARDTAADLQGVHFLPEAGMAFVRDGDSYLAVTAGYHGAAHKHSDDTGLLLIERGGVILGDAGRWGYYEEEPDRVYARSAGAHNVLTVGWEDFPWRKVEPYGSGLVAVSVEQGGWYVITVRNPLLERQEITHQRVLFYRPGKALMIVEQVRSPQRNEYIRRLHFGPELELEQRGDHGIAVTGRGIAATLYELTEGTELALIRGRESPRSGWTYPADRERRETWTATFRDSDKDLRCITALSFESEHPIEDLPTELTRLIEGMGS